MATPIDRASRQRRAALNLANEVRAARADLKDLVAGDPSWQTLIDVVAGKRDGGPIAGMRIVDLLVEAPGMGPAKARRAMRAAGLDRDNYAAVLFGWLTPIRRVELAHALKLARRNLTDAAVARVAAAARQRRPRRRPAE